MSRSRQRHKLRLFLLRWHRRVGVLIALVVIMLVVTGIPLNHTSQWKLDRVTLRTPWLLGLYGIEATDSLGYRVDAHWLIQAGAHLYLDETEVARCTGPLVGAVAVEAMFIAACARELVLLTDTGVLIEKIGSTYGIPEPLTGLARAGDKVWLGSDSRWYQLDLDSLTWSRQKALPASVRIAVPAAIPIALQEAVKGDLLGDSITLERVLLDLHSGRLFGRATVWLIDLAALLLLLIALSGCYVWLSKPGRFRQR